MHAVAVTNLLVPIVALGAASVPAANAVSDLGVAQDALAVLQEHMLLTFVASAIVVTLNTSGPISIALVALFLFRVVVPFVVGTGLAG